MVCQQYTSRYDSFVLLVSALLSGAGEAHEFCEFVVLSVMETVCAMELLGW